MLLLKKCVKEQLLIILMLTSTAFSLSLMCYVTGGGFASSYYSGVVFCIIVSSVFLRIENRNFITMILIILALHFSLLSLIPFRFIDLMIHIFFVGCAALFMSVIHAIILYFSTQIKMLQDFLPICMHCK